MSHFNATPAGAPERVLITGGGAGIGAAIAERCRAEGHLPVVIDRVVDPVHGGIRADLSDAADTARALHEALAAGPITRLVNNVGVVVPADAEHQTLAEFDLAVSLNLRCAFQCMQALLPGMKAAGFGRIVNMSSRAALGKGDRIVYSATKAGLIGLTRTLAMELGADGITVNAIGPGPIATELFRQSNPEGAPQTERILKSIAVGRMGTAEDVARAVLFFLSPDNGFVTGQVLYVCGGTTLGVAPV